MDEHDVQLPRPLSATESEEAWSGVSSSADGEEVKEAKEVKAEPRGAYPRAAGEELLLGWLKSALQCDAAAALSTMALAVGAHVLLPGPQRSSAPGGGTESTEQTLDLDEISLWLESDRLSSRPEGKGLQPIP